MKTKKLFGLGCLAAAILAAIGGNSQIQAQTITNTFTFTFATGGATSDFNSTWIYSG